MGHVRLSAKISTIIIRIILVKRLSSDFSEHGRAHVRSQGWDFRHLVSESTADRTKRLALSVQRYVLCLVRVLLSMGVLLPVR